MGTFSYSNRDNKSGKFRLIDKNELIIPEESYQRAATSDRRVKEIADNWDWRLVQTISVAERNGKYYVFDGGHRVRAAMMKDGAISKLPCMVYDTESTVDEAKSYLGLQKNRTSVSAYDNHKAGLSAKDPMDILVKKIVESGAYHISRSNSDFVFQAVSLLKWAINLDVDIAENVFQICSEIAGGNRIHSIVFKGLFWAELQYQKQTHRTLLTDGNIDKLRKQGMDRLLQSINSASVKSGMSRSTAIAARGIMIVIDKGRRTRTKVDLGNETE